VIAEQIGSPHVVAQRIDGAVPAGFDHLEHRSAILGGVGQEPAVQAVAAELGRIEPGMAAISFDDGRDAGIGRNTGPSVIAAATSHVCTASLYAGRRLARKQVSSRLIPAQQNPPVSTSSDSFRHLNGSSLVFAFLSPT
jgi:hypothetical protein